VPAAAAEVLIAGAGPVGLLLANLLGRAGIPTLILEKRTVRATPGAGSRAIGITPTSLQILAELGLEERFRERGVQVRRTAVYSDAGLLARVEIPFILSLPQAVTESLLLESLDRWPAVQLLTGRQVVEVREGGGVVAVKSEGVRETYEARVACACDGSSSPLAVKLGVRRRVRRYPVAFRMADYTDSSGLGEEARLYFTHQGSVESFPLPGGQRRWIVQAERAEGVEPSYDEVEAAVAARTGLCLDPRERVWASSFRPERSVLERFRAGRVVFCGDAAHTMAPIGGQGMNTGFADAHLLARVLERWLLEGAELEPLLAVYERYRRVAFGAASRRSRLFMGVGTLRAPGLRTLRNLLARALARPPFLKLLAGHFTMRNVPYSTLAAVEARESRLLPGAEAQPDEPSRR